MLVETSARQAGEIADANVRCTPLRVLRGAECDIRKDGSVDLPDDVLVPLVVSTDAHSVTGLDHMQLAVATARRAWATATDVLNTSPTPPDQDDAGGELNNGQAALTARHRLGTSWDG